jgi:hypothetical protein
MSFILFLRFLSFSFVGKEYARWYLSSQNAKECHLFSAVEILVLIRDQLNGGGALSPSLREKSNNSYYACVLPYKVSP